MKKLEEANRVLGIEVTTKWQVSQSNQTFCKTGLGAFYISQVLHSVAI